MLSGTFPFENEDEEKLYSIIRKGKYQFSSPLWDNISTEAKDFISKLLTQRNNRLNAADSLKHQFIRSYY